MIRKKLWIIVSILLLAASVILIFGKWKYNHTLNMIGFTTLIIIGLLNIFDSLFRQNKNK